jgi:hypothetical protein
MEKNIKLTDMQIFVVDALREGAEIIAKYTKVYGPGFNLTYKSLKYHLEYENGGRWRIHHSTILSLIEKKVINKRYELTKKFL